MDRGPEGPQSMGLKRVEHNWALMGWDLPMFITPTLASIISYMTAHQFSSVAKSCLTVTPWTAACQASLFITNCWSLLKLMSIKLVMPSEHLIFCRPLLLPPSICPSIRVFSNESVLRIRWSESWSFSFSISPSNWCSRLISFRSDWFDLLSF